MFNYPNNQMFNQQIESDEEVEVIEIYERDRYDPRELSPSNINFILPGKSSHTYFNHMLNNNQNAFAINSFQNQCYTNNLQFYTSSSKNMNKNNENISNNIIKNSNCTNENALCVGMEMNQILNLDYLMTKFNLNPKINLKQWGKLHKFMIKIIFQIRNIK